jgi:hypothetical protein
MMVKFVIRIEICYMEPKAKETTTYGCSGGPVLCHFSLPHSSSPLSSSRLVFGVSISGK